MGQKSEARRLRRRAFYQENFGSRALLAAGFVAIAALLANPFTLSWLPFVQRRLLALMSASNRLLLGFSWWAGSFDNAYLFLMLCFYFYILALSLLFVYLVGKRNNLFITFLIILGIVFFNLLVPYGQVLLSIGPFKVTLQALVSGIHKAVTLEALIMLSRAAIRQDLRLPGKFGGLIGDSFRILEQITERKESIRRKDIAGSIDRLLFALDNEPPQGAAAPVRTNGKGCAALILACLCAWLPFLSLFIVPL
jgi:heptaprenyl diphosphate synthase